MTRATCSALLSFVLFAPAASAADGLLEINQACATAAAGCFPGDAAGFPVRISQSGSYRLTGGLTVPANTTAILIEAPNVKLDLGGFEVRGPNTCTGYPAQSCTLQEGAPGIHAPSVNEFLVSVRNGTVTGMAGACINLQGNSSSVADATVYYCGQGGAGASGFDGAITVGAYGRVSGSHSSNSAGSGIRLGDGGAAHDNEVRGHKQVGIVAPLAPHGGLWTGNRAFDNGSGGLFAFGSVNQNVLVSKNVASGNLSAQISGSIESTGDNLCGGVLC